MPEQYCWYCSVVALFRRIVLRPDWLVACLRGNGLSRERWRRVSSHAQNTFCTGRFAHPMCFTCISCRRVVVLVETGQSLEGSGRTSRCPNCRLQHSSFFDTQYVTIVRLRKKRKFIRIHASVIMIDAKYSRSHFRPNWKWTLIAFIQWNQKRKKGQHQKRCEAMRALNCKRSCKLWLSLSIQSAKILA